MSKLALWATTGRPPILSASIGQRLPPAETTAPCPTLRRRSTRPRPESRGRRRSWPSSLRLLRRPWPWRWRSCPSCRLEGRRTESPCSRAAGRDPVAWSVPQSRGRPVHGLDPRAPGAARGRPAHNDAPGPGTGSPRRRAWSTTLNAGCCTSAPPGPPTGCSCPGQAIRPTIWSDALRWRTAGAASMSHGTWAAS